MAKLAFGDALRGISITQLFGVIRDDADFNHMQVAVKVTEPVNNEKFSVYYSKDMSDKKTKEWTHYEDLCPNDKEEAREIRKMKREPKNIIGYLVEKTIGDEVQRELFYMYVEHPRLGGLPAEIKIAESYFEFRNLTTAEEVTAHVNKCMDDNENLYQFKRQIGLV